MTRTHDLLVSSLSALTTTPWWITAAREHVWREKQGPRMTCKAAYLQIELLIPSVLERELFLNPPPLPDFGKIIFLPESPRQRKRSLKSKKY